jgi:hypothetical protein
MKSILNRILVALIIVILCFSSVSIFNVKANPFIHGGMVDPDSSTKPPTISILSLKNSTTYKEDRINLSFNTSLGYSRTAIAKFILEIYYQTDWQNKTIYVYKSSSGKELENPFNLNLTKLPDGNHTIKIIACEMGDYAEGNYKYTFMINGSSNINFAVDTQLESPNSLELIPSQTRLFLASVAIVVIIVAFLGILVYFKKRKLISRIIL